jgi:hypothetical protein
LKRLKDHYKVACRQGREVFGGNYFLERQITNEQDKKLTKSPQPEAEFLPAIFLTEEN